MMATLGGGRGSVLHALFHGLFVCCTARLACRDNLGNEVSWYTVYKMPQGHSPTGKTAEFPPHLYLDFNKPAWSWSTEGHGLDSPAQAVGLTLKQVYEAHGSEAVGYFFYNDDKPEGLDEEVTSTHAHAKGVFAVAANGSGFWLVHSVPKYPPRSGATYSYPQSGSVYGQHFLCVTVEKDDFDRIGYQLRLNDVWLYDVNFPAGLRGLSSNLTKLSEGSSIDGTATTSDVSTLQTTPAANAFVSFAKSASFGKDLYDGLVAPALRAHLLTETWSRGSQTNNMDSTCETTYQVRNILSLANADLGVGLSNSEDHSKFALSSNQHICVGDINRQVSQTRRGGGAVCFLSPQAATAYRSLVDKTQPCPAQTTTTRDRADTGL